MPEKYTVIIELDITAPLALTAAQRDDAKDLIAKHVSPIPMLPNNATAGVKSVSFKETR